MEIHEKLKGVHDQATFLKFVRALTTDREKAAKLEKRKPAAPYGPDAGGWENTSIETYLEAATAWAEDTSFGESQGISPENPWRQFATFLYLGKIYE